jgi:hypothetical protein
MFGSILYLLDKHWKTILFLIIIGLIITSKSEEGFYGWIPMATRNTYNMSYDLRGDPYIDRRKVYPYRTREWLGPFLYGLFPKWFISPRHPLANLN